MNQRDTLLKTITDMMASVEYSATPLSDRINNLLLIEILKRLPDVQDD